MKRWRRKQTSKRRWLAKYKLGRWIPMFAIVAHQLDIDLNAVEYNGCTQHVRRSA